MSALNNKSKKWILIVEDDPDAREVIMDDIFDAFGNSIKFVEAKDGVEATHKLTFQAFDCITTDLNMPNRDGQHFIEFVKKSPLNASTPLIVITGFPDPVLIKKHKEEIYFFDKPYDQADLTRAIDTQLKLGRMDQRVGATFLNTLVDVCDKFSDQVLSSKVEVLEPAVKKPFEDLSGDVICSMRVKTPHGGCRLALGFDNTVIEKLREITEIGSHLKTEKIIESALNVIFKLTKKMFLKNTGDVPTLEETHFFMNKGHFDYREIKKPKGVVIPIKTDHGKIYAQALYIKSVDPAKKKKEAA